MRWAYLMVMGTVLGTGACVAPDLATAGKTPRGGRSEAHSAKTTAEPMVAPKLAERFPDAALLDEAKFVETIQGRTFHYQEVESAIIVERPAEFFLENGRYSAGHRVISQGTYSFERGVALIECASCPPSFLGLGPSRMFFSSMGRIFMANSDGEGAIIELIPTH